MKSNLKLSNIWENFDEFVELCENSGTIDTKHKISIVKTFFNEQNIFDGDWNNLMRNILLIFQNDKRIASKFDYSKETITFTQENLKKQSEKSKIYQDIFNKLLDTSRNNQTFGSLTKSNTILDLIQCVRDNSIIIEIVGSKKREKIDKFHVTLNSYNTEKFDLYYEHTTNDLSKKTLTLVEPYIENTAEYDLMNFYSEIRTFIEAKYYNKYPPKINYEQFCKLLYSYIWADYLITVPNKENNILRYSDNDIKLLNKNDIDKYLNGTNIPENKLNFGMIKYNHFIIDREEDRKIERSIMETENEWGKLRSANGSRKGFLNTTK